LFSCKNVTPDRNLEKKHLHVGVSVFFNVGRSGYPQVSPDAKFEGFKKIQVL